MTEHGLKVTWKSAVMFEKVINTIGRKLFSMFLKYFREAF